jgi:hypothetical protein
VREGEPQGVGRGSGMVFAAQAQTLIGAAGEVAGGAGPGMEGELPRSA